MNHPARPPSFSEEVLAHTAREAKLLAEGHLKLASRTGDAAVQQRIEQLRTALDEYTLVTETEFNLAKYGAALERLQESMDALRTEWTRSVRSRT